VEEGVGVERVGPFLRGIENVARLDGAANTANRLGQGHFGDVIRARVTYALGRPIRAQRQQKKCSQK